MTAEELSVNLEVSERTIYRDLDALGMAGVPVYSEHGPGGGYALLDSYRTTLTGLNEDEVRTLFASGAYGPLKDLGLGDSMDKALLKLAAALPEPQQHRAERMRRRIHLDARGWFQSPEAVPHLDVLQEATWNDQYIHIRYRRSDGEVRERMVAPFGLVAKATIWYLVASVEGDLRVYRVGRILEVELLPEYFEQPEGFDLAKYWTQWCAEFERNRPEIPVTMRVSPWQAAIMAENWGDHVRAMIENAPSDNDGWRQITLSYDSLEWARDSLIRFCPEIEVLEPTELRQSIIDHAANVMKFYTQPG
jgi:predicted DNA-binding transcriptional regulator YafY